MLRNVSLPNTPSTDIATGASFLGTPGLLARAAAGFAMFDVPSHFLPRAGMVDVQLIAPSDGRAYAIRRSLDIPEHWQVHDQELGWLAASGAVDTERWLRSNLSVPDELTLPRLFRDVVSFSIPATLSWLLAEPGLRERQFAQLLRTERYPSGARWLDTVQALTSASALDLSRQVAREAGQDVLFDRIRRQYELAREGSLRADEHVAKLRLDLAGARANQERLSSLEQELRGVQRDLQGRRLTLAGLEAQLERWGHWLSVGQRAQRGLAEHEPDVQAFQASSTEITKLASRLTGIDAVRAELLAASADVLALQREQALLDEERARLREAEQTASDLAESVHQQQQLEQQIPIAQDRAVRLDLANRALQASLTETKRIELLLTEAERQLAELEPLSSQTAQVKKLERELEQQQTQLRDISRHVEQLHVLEGAIRSVGVHLDELRKGASLTERLSIKAAGNGARAGERTAASQLREAIDHQIEALDRQLRDWQAQTRELASAPQQANQLRANLHQLEQELTAARKMELRHGAAPALRMHAKHLHERLEQLRASTEAHIKEQQECAAAPARLSQLRHDLAALNDPRSERAALAKLAARKEAVETELRQVRRKLEERGAHQTQLGQQLAGLVELRVASEVEERRHEAAREGYDAYVGQQAVAELAASAEQELNAVRSSIDAQQHIQEQTEAHESGLLASIKELEPAATQVPALEVQLVEAEVSAVDWRTRYQQSAEELAAAEDNRARLRESERELTVHSRAQALLEESRAAIQEAEAVLGGRLRRELAAGATTYLRLLLDEGDAELTWPWMEAPAVVRAGAAYPLDALDLTAQACCVLAFRLALAGDASGLRTVFISGLDSLPDPRAIVGRLDRLTDFDQFLLPSGW